MRFNREGTIDRRIFAYNPRAAAGTSINPVLAAGDLIRVNDSILSGGVNVLNELTGPFVGLYSVYSVQRPRTMTILVPWKTNLTSHPLRELMMKLIWQVFGALRRRKS